MHLLLQLFLFTKALSGYRCDEQTGKCEGDNNFFDQKNTCYINKIISTDGKTMKRIVPPGAWCDGNRDDDDEKTNNTLAI